MLKKLKKVQKKLKKVEKVSQKKKFFKKNSSLRPDDQIRNVIVSSPSTTWDRKAWDKHEPSIQSKGKANQQRSSHGLERLATSARRDQLRRKL